MIRTTLRFLRISRTLMPAVLLTLACATFTAAQSVTEGIEPNNTFSTAQNVGALPPLAGGSISVTGSRVGDSSADFFSFFVDAGRTFTLATNPLPGVDPFDTDTILGLFDPDGNQVAFSDDGGAGFTAYINSYTASISGFFRAAVSGFGDGLDNGATFDDDDFQTFSPFIGGGDAGFDYELVIEAQNAAPQVAAIPEPTTLLLLGISLMGTGVAVIRKRSGNAR